MFKIRRRGATLASATDLPFCSMCGQAIRVDVTTGRCALGHRVTPVAASVEAIADLADIAADATVVTPDAEHTLVTFDEQPYTPAAQAGPAWGVPVTDDQTAAATEGFADLLTWDEPGDALSALDVDPTQLGEDEGVEPAPSPVTTELAGGLLDELDDAAYARRQAVGTLGATIGVTAAFLAAVAALPF